MPYVVPPAGRFVLGAAHIVERHGLLVLITLGESVVAAYLIGDAVFRRLLGIGPAMLRAVAALLCLATIPLGRWTAGEAELVVLVTVLVAMLVLERRPGRL